MQHPIKYNGKNIGYVTRRDDGVWEIEIERILMFLKDSDLKSPTPTALQVSRNLERNDLGNFTLSGLDIFATAKETRVVICKD